MRRRSNARWVFGVIAPWWLAAGALVSFTASAEQDPSSGWSRAPRLARTLPTFAPSPTELSAGAEPTSATVELARLSEGSILDLHALPDEREPHPDLKPNIRDFPAVDRTRKGDPVVAIRPSIDGRLRGLPVIKLMKSESLSFDLAKGEPRLLLAPRVSPDSAEFAQRAAEEWRWPQQFASSRALPAAVTPQPPAISDQTRDRAAHGATPVTPRAVALSSSTPAQPDALPIEVAAIPRSPFSLAGPNKPDYAAMIHPDKIDAEKRCLAEAVYFEARSEPEAGQAAVAQVVLNRVSSGLYPDNICGVVYQNRHHYHACQFSFACEGKSLQITERESGRRRCAWPMRCSPAGPSSPGSASRRITTPIT